MEWKYFKPLDGDSEAQPQYSDDATSEWFLGEIVQGTFKPTWQVLETALECRETACWTSHWCKTWQTEIEPIPQSDNLYEKKWWYNKQHMLKLYNPGEKKRYISFSPNKPPHCMEAYVIEWRNQISSRL